MTKTEVLSVDLPRIDGGTQSRVKINEDTVQDYTDVIIEANGEWPFPPLDVFHDGSEYFMADGFHRFLAAHRAKRGSFPCKIHKGTAADARIFGMTANDRNGLRMTRADKRACVEWLLDNGGKLTQTEIAEKAGVTRRTVTQIVANRKSQNAQTSQPSGGGTNASSRSDPVQDAAVGPPGPAGGAVSSAGPSSDLGKCPNCAGTKWDEDEDGFHCSKCYHPHGEPAGDPDEDRIKTQRQKTVKTVEALMRAFDDLQTMQAREEHGGATAWKAEEVLETIADMGVIAACKGLLKLARGWK